MGLKTGEPDLDLQGKFGLKTKQFLSYPVNATTFEPWEFCLQT